MSFALFERALGPLWDAIRSFVSRGVVRNTLDTDKKQTAQVDLGHGDLRAGLENWQSYGMTGRAPDGAEALVLGRGSLAAVICVEDRRYRIQSLEKGEVALYTDEGITVKFKRNRIVQIVGANIQITATEILDLGAGTSVIVTAPDIQLNAGTSAIVTAPDIQITADENIQITADEILDLGAGTSAIVTAPDIQLNSS